MAKDLYQMFGETARLAQIMRQQGEDDGSIQFRTLLQDLRLGEMTDENCRFLRIICLRTFRLCSKIVFGSTQPALRLGEMTDENCRFLRIICLRTFRLCSKIVFGSTQPALPFVTITLQLYGSVDTL